MSIPLLLRHLPSTVLHWDGHEYRTSRQLLDMGIGLCSDCASFLPGFPGDNTCPHCKTIALVVPDTDQEGNPIPPKKTFLPKPFTKHKDLLEKCDRCNGYLMFRTKDKRCYWLHSQFRSKNRIRVQNEMMFYKEASEKV